MIVHDREAASGPRTARAAPKLFGSSGGSGGKPVINRVKVVIGRGKRTISQLAAAFHDIVEVQRRQLCHRVGIAAEVLARRNRCPP